MDEEPEKTLVEEIRADFRKLKAEVAEHTADAERFWNKIRQRTKRERDAAAREEEAEAAPAAPQSERERLMAIDHAFRQRFGGGNRGAG